MDGRGDSHSAKPLYVHIYILIDHGNDAEQVVQTPLRDISSTSNATERISGKGKEESFEGAGFDVFEKWRFWPSQYCAGKQKVELLQLLKKGMK